ncbi:Spectrin beta chain non-erythrocytic 5 [Bienertia sinuspersici]
MYNIFQIVAIRFALCQRRSNCSKESLEKAKVKPIHTTSVKSHARVCEDMTKSSNKGPTQTQVYLKCHQHESEADITNQIKNVATEQGDQELDLDKDPISKVLGKDIYGHACGLGLGVKPSDVGDRSYPLFLNGLNMSTDNEAAAIHYFHRLEGVV